MAEARNKAVSSRMSMKLREVFGPEDGEDFADLLRTVTEQGDSIRAELADFRKEMRADIQALNVKISEVQSNLMKWSFVFWVGAVLAIAVLAGVLR